MGAANSCYAGVIPGSNSAPVQDLTRMISNIMGLFCHTLPPQAGVAGLHCVCVCLHLHRVCVSPYNDYG